MQRKLIVIACFRWRDIVDAAASSTVATVAAATFWSAAVSWSVDLNAATRCISECDILVFTSYRNSDRRGGGDLRPFRAQMEIRASCSGGGGERMCARGHNERGNSRRRCAIGGTLGWRIGAGGGGAGGGDGGASGGGGRR